MAQHQAAQAADWAAADCHGFSHVTRAERASLLHASDFVAPIDDYHGAMRSALTSQQRFFNAAVMVTYEIDDGAVQPLTVCINGEEVNAEHFGLHQFDLWAQGIALERAEEAALRGQDAAQDAAAERWAA